MSMSGSFLPSLGRQQPQSTRVEGADIVMKSTGNCSTNPISKQFVASGTNQNSGNTLGGFLFVLPLFAQFRSYPDDFGSAVLNRVDGIDVVHVKSIGITFKIDGPLHAATEVLEELGAQATAFDLLIIHEEAAIRAYIHGERFLPRTCPRDDAVVTP